MVTPSRLQKLEALLADDPGDPFLRYGLALEHVSQGNEETGVRLLLELIQAQPPLPRLLNGLRYFGPGKFSLNSLGYLEIAVSLDFWHFHRFAWK